MNIINETQSLCPICKKPVKAFYIEEANKVFFLQKCDEHGDFKTLAAENPGDFEAWIKYSVINIPPQRPLTQGDYLDGECPLHCGPCQNHLQTACCVLIDVTQRCNQHCPYCFAKSGELIDPSEPSLEEIGHKYDFLLSQGEGGREFNIQLSGGEPTVRDDLPEIIKMARDKGFSYVQINSNGRRLADEEGYAKLLKKAGASVIFMQFDGTEDDIYMKLRGEALVNKKLQAIRNCEKAGLPVTLVPTVVKGINDHNIGKMIDFMIENVNIVKGIHFQPASFFGRFPEEDEAYGRITMLGLLRELERQKPEFQFSNSMPVATGHTLCCFYSTYVKEPDGSIRSTMTPSQKENNISCCDLVNIDALEVIKRDRDYVLNKWDAEVTTDNCCEKSGSLCCCGTEHKSSEDITDLDEFLTYFKRNTFTVTGMAFQDATNLDAERLKRCRVVQLTDDNKIIPFCAYNTIYR